MNRIYLPVKFSGSWSTCPVYNHQHEPLNTGMFFFSDETIRALVTTNEGKIYSNGLPLQLFETMSGEEILQTSHKGTLLLRRILTFPMVTVAAISGKCPIVTLHVL